MKKKSIFLIFFEKYTFIVTTQHPMGISNRLTVVLQQELH